MDTELSCEVADLVALMRAGDLTALDRFSRCYGTRLIAVARQSCRLHDDAEDAVQDALVEAGRSLDTYRGEGSPLAWLSTLVVRRCHRLGRGRRNDPGLHVADVEVPCACHDPEVQAEHGELAERLGTALLALPETDRFAVMLANEGYSGPEIAAELGLSADGVRGRLKRARSRLREQLADLA
ncbi:MAG: sigma-70 family RNA polymerase sigma factor [Myxococcota bacterium]